MSDELKPPKKIYLQMLDEDGEEQDEITWCEDEINDTDIAYVLAAELQSTITTQADMIQRLKEDGDRLAESWKGNNDGDEYCVHCCNPVINSQVKHDADCPITLHNQLTQELEKREG